MQRHSHRLERVRRQALELATEHPEWQRWAAEKIVRTIRGKLQRKAYKRMVRRHRMARRIQTSLVRTYLARGGLVRASHAYWAASELQRWTRGELRRARLRAWNAHEMLAAAYANTAKLLVKRQRAA